MKKFSLIAFVTAAFLLAGFALFAQDVPGSVPIDDCSNWFCRNWAAIALIASEAASLISKKYSGIIRILIGVLGDIVKKKV